MADDNADATNPAAIARLLRRRLHEGTMDVPVTGSSMGTTVATGSTVTIVARDRPGRGEVWCYVDDEGRTIVHRVLSVSGEVVWMRGDGNRSNDRPVTLERMVGRATRVVGGAELGAVDRLIALARQARAGVRRRIGRNDSGDPSNP